MLLNISFYRPLRLLLAPCPTHPHASPCIFSHILPLSPFHAWTASNSVTLQRCRNSSRWLSPWQIYLYRFVLTASLTWHTLPSFAYHGITWDIIGLYGRTYPVTSASSCPLWPWQSPMLFGTSAAGPPAPVPGQEIQKSPRSMKWICASALYLDAWYFHTPT